MATRRDLRSGPAWASDEGVAALEFVLALPFIWLILILIFNFGQAFLERQRANVALREVALRHGADIAEVGPDTPINPHADELAYDTLNRRGMAAQFFYDRRSDGTCPEGTGGAADDSWQVPGLDTIGGFLATLSASHTYEVVAEGPPIVGPFVPQPQHEACFVVDHNPWTIHETGTPGTWLNDLLGPLGPVLDALF